MSARETSYSDLTYIAERLGNEATVDDAQSVVDLAVRIATEQGDTEFNTLDWLSNRTYDWTRLWEAAHGDMEALAEVRREAGLSVLV